MLEKFQSSRDKYHSLRTEYDHLLGTKKSIECIAFCVRRCWALNCHGCNGLQRPRRPSLRTTSASGPIAASRSRPSSGSNRCRADFSMRRLQILTFRNRCLSIGRVTAADQSGIQEMYSLHSWRPGEGPPLLRPDPRASFCGTGAPQKFAF